MEMESAPLLVWKTSKYVAKLRFSRHGKKRLLPEGRYSCLNCILSRGLWGHSVKCNSSLTTLIWLRLRAKPLYFSAFNGICMDARWRAKEQAPYIFRPAWAECLYRSKIAWRGIRGVPRKQAIVAKLYLKSRKEGLCGMRRRR